MLFWPSWPLVPQFGGDQSWQLGLVLAAELGLQWGTDVIFTYGPLGYMEFAMAISRDHMLAAAGVHVLAATAAVLAAYSLCRSRLEMSRVGAVATAAVVAGISIYLVEALYAALILGSVVVLVSRSWLAVVLVGIGLGVIGQQKLSDAVLVLGVATLCTIGALRWRGLLLLAAVTAAAWLGAWVVAGQAIVEIPGWLAGAIEISLGHAAALSLRLPGMAWHYPVAILLSAASVVVAWLVGRQLDRLRLVTLMLAVAWVVFLAWQAAFNRHDVGHAVLFFSAIAVTTLAVGLAGGRTTSLGASLLTAAFAYVAMVAIGTPFLGPVDREPSLRTAGRAAQVMTSAYIRDAFLRDTAAQLREQFAITPELRAAMGSEPTLADPGDITAVWAAEGPAWQPTPPLQLITSFTDDLDRASEEDLLETPRQILRRTPHVANDDRYPAWESPRYQRLVYCRYDAEFESPGWLLLRSTGVDICQAPEELQTVDVEAGEVVSVPYVPGTTSLVTIEPSTSIVDSILGLVLKPTAVHVDYGGQRWRYANGDVATRALLNGPVSHPALDSLPLTPYSTISLDRPAHLTFESSAIERAPVPTSLGRPISLEDVVIRAAASVPDPGLAIAPDVVQENDVTAALTDEACLRISATGGDPFVVVAVPDGRSLQVTNDAGGDAQVFLEVEGRYVGDAPRSFTMGTEPIEIAVPPHHPSGLAHIRLDPPDQAVTEVCVAPQDPTSS